MRECEGVGVGLALGLRMGWGGDPGVLRGCGHQVAPATPELASEGSGPHPGPGCSRLTFCRRSMRQHWPAAPLEAGAHVERTEVRLGPAPEARASQRAVVSSSLGPLWAADHGWLEGQ